MSPSAPTVGVVIPVHNRARLVLDTLDSVAAQGRPVDRLVVVDDGSADDTPEVVENWLLEHPVLSGQLLRRAHGGASRARNAGLKAAGAVDFVSFLDSDDLWPPDLVARATEALAEETDLVAASADRLFWHVDSDLKKPRSSADLTRDPILWFVRRGAGIGSCTFLRRDAVVAVGGYPENVPTGHDTLLFGRVSQRGRWGYLPGAPVVFKRDHAGDGKHADHIHRDRPQALEQWAELTEGLLAELPAECTSRREIRRAMGRRWLQAARRARKDGRLADAIACLKRGRSWQPPSSAMLWEYLRTWAARS